MEYILFGLGIVIVAASLFLTYKNNTENSNYLQSELLSELREVKNELEARLNELEGENFSAVLDKQVEEKESNKKLTTKMNSIQEKIIELEEKIDRLENKINYSLSNSVSSAANTMQNKTEETEEDAEDSTYQKIEELVDEGLSLPEVAQKLDMGTREVRLIWKFNSRGEE